MNRTATIAVLAVAMLGTSGTTALAAPSNPSASAVTNKVATIKDARKDMVTDWGSRSQWPGPLDVWRVTGTVANGRLVVIGRFANLTTANTFEKTYNWFEGGAGVVWTDQRAGFSALVTTDTGQYGWFRDGEDGTVTLGRLYRTGPGTWGQEDVDCTGGTSVINVKTERVRLSVPLSCMGDPTRARVQLDVVDYRRGLLDVGGPTGWFATS